MDIAKLIELFQWMTILNLAMLCVWCLLYLCLRKFILRWHRKWFGMSKKQVAGAIYLCFGLYKVFIFLFVIMPYIALIIMSCYQV